MTIHSAIRGARHRQVSQAMRHAGVYFVTALLATVAPGATLTAQTTVEALGGTTLRYHGDTIWRMRDTTMTRVVLRGDTVRRVNYMHGKPAFSAIYAMKGDQAVLVEQRGGDGKLRPVPDTSRLVPLLLMTGELQMLETTIRSNALAARMSSMRGGMPGPEEASLSPATPTTYPASANLTIVHHLDTVRYIRGCTAAPPVDTTVYTILLGDSLRRVSPAPRTFGKQMLMAVRADMNSVLLRRRVNAEPPPADIPRLRKWPCDNR